MQLQDHVQEFKAAGIDVVALTYDSPALQQKFIDRFHISYPMLSDVAATSVKNLGVLNTEYKPGSDGYGVPYPGAIILNREQKIVGKIFLEGYSTRVDAQGVLAYAQQALSGGATH